MKRLLVIALFLVLVISLVSACGGKAATTTSTTTTAPPPTTSTRTSTTTQPITTLPTQVVATTSSTPAPTAQSALPPGVWPVKAPPAGQTGGNFIWASTLGIANMGSHIDANSPSMTYPIFEPLLRTDEDGRLFGWLAESWTVSPDKTNITLNLRKGVKFHDGTDFNAEAVKYNLEQVLAANLPGSFVLKKVSSYDIVDTYTLRINLSTYDQTLLLRLAQTVLGQISSPTAMKTKTTPEERAVGTGPYKFDSWKRDDFIKAVKNPNYWQKGKPYLDSVTYRAIIDPTNMLMALKAGEVHVIQPIEPVDVMQFRSEGYEGGPQGLSWIHGIIPDGGNPDSPFANKKVRKALEYAIDRKGFVEGIGMGLYSIVYQQATKANPWYDASLPAYEYSTAKAKQLLAEAGYANGFKTTLVTDVRGRKDFITAIVTYLKNVGIDAEVDIATVPRITELQQKGWKGILYPGFPQPINLVNYIGRWGDPNNYVSFYHPPDWQKNWEALYSEPDDAKREAKLKELVRILYDESITIPLADTNSLYARKKDQVQNFWFHSNSTSGWWESADIWIKR